MRLLSGVAFGNPWAKISFPGWTFGTTLATGRKVLGGGLWWFQTLFVFTYLGRFPFWLIFFRWVETANQSSFAILCRYFKNKAFIQPCAMSNPALPSSQIHGNLWRSLQRFWVETGWARRRRLLVPFRKPSSRLGKDPGAEDEKRWAQTLPSQV